MQRPIGKKVLAVDDERHIARLVQINLKGAGYEVVTALDGYEALEKIEQERPDLLVMDVIMPYMSGLEVLERLRACERTRDLPVILLTVLAEDSALIQCELLLCSAYLAKPFNPTELIASVDRVLLAQELKSGSLLIES
ncbi:MAG TPA: response regulator [Chthonomonadaceae bacterium]|nr:response regulator [Chthonomonadaceae bacterium]